MTTSLPAYEIHLDQEISVTMIFDIEAKGSPEHGWEITKAILTETAVWLNDDQAEPATDCCADRTDWLNRFLSTNDDDWDRLEAALADQYESDHDLNYAMGSESYGLAVALCVD